MSETITTFFGDRRRETTAQPPMVPELTPEQAALVAEACSKSKVLWVRPSDGVRDHLAWHVWHDSAVYVIYGVDEQMLPVLDGATEVIVRSKDSGARLVRFLARAEVIPARTPEWDAAADALSAARLNAQNVSDQRERWATGCMISKLVPLRLLASGAGESDTPSGAASPPTTGATTNSWRPWHFGGRPQRRRGTVN